MHQTAIPPVLEALEPRLAPAGIVAVAVKNGVLSLTGDAEENIVRITDLGNGTWRIHDSVEDPYNDPTTFRLNGSDTATAEVIVTGIKSLSADLKSGGGGIFLEGLEMAGNVTVKNAKVGQSITFQDTTIGGTTHLSAPAITVIADNSIFNGALTIKGGRFDDGIYLHGGTYRSISADLGDGYNIFSLADVDEGPDIRVLGDVSVTAKGSIFITNTVSLGAENLFIGGNLKVNLTGGESQLSLGTSEILGNVSFQAGAGKAEAVLLGDLKIGGNVDFKFGKGSHSIVSENLRSLTAGALTYNVGAGSNIISIDTQELHIRGDATFRLASASSTSLTLNATAEGSIGGKFTYLGSKGDDTLTLAGSLNIGGLFEMKAGNGRNTLNTSEDLRSLTLGALKYTGGNAHDKVSLSYADLTILGDVNINLGAVPYAGEFEKIIYLGYGADVTIHGDVTTSQGSLLIRGEQVRILGHVSHTSLKIGAMLTVAGTDVIIGSISVKGSAGQDELTLGRHDSANQKLLVLGDVTANLGKLSSGVTLYDTAVLGSVAITAATNEPPEGGGPELFLFADSLFAGSVSVKATGTANTTLRIHNSTFSSAVTLDTGRGNDTVYLDSPLPTSGNLEARNTFHGPVRILLGAGDDTLNLNPDSSQAHYGNNFLSTFFADGGPGTNTAPGLDSPNNEFDTEPVLKNFTLLSPG